jgi:hypothetical protein
MNNLEQFLLVQRSLLGNVVSNLAGVYMDVSGEVVRFVACYFSEPTPYDKEHLDDAAAETMADFSDGYLLDMHHVLISSIIFHDVKWLFLRAEANEFKK